MLPLLLQSSELKAQPESASTQRPASLSTEEKASAEQLITKAERQALADKVISLSVKDATLPEVTAQIQKALPRGFPLEVRRAGEITLTCTLHEKPLGEVLHALATLSGTKFHLLTDRMLLAPEGSLSMAELKAQLPWSPQSSVLTRQAAAFKIAGLAAQAMEQQKKDVASFGDFSPDHQRLLQYMADHLRSANQNRRVMLSPEARVRLTNRPNGRFDLVIDLLSQNAQMRWVNYPRGR